MAINLEILDASQSQLTQNEQVKNMIDKGCDVVCVNLVDRTDDDGAHRQERDGRTGHGLRARLHLRERCDIA